MPIFPQIIAALPFVAFVYVSVLLYKACRPLAFAISVTTVLLCFFAHPTIQTVGDYFFGYPYAKSKEALAIEADIVGRPYEFVVERLGQPDSVKVVPPAVVIETKTRKERNPEKRSEMYQKLEYSLSPLLYTATRFIVFLDMDGVVKSHRVKWEYGEGR